MRLLLALLIPLAGCTGLRVHVGAHMLASGLYAIERYDATISERGILRADPETEVVKRVRYARLWHVDAEVLSPAEHKGERFVFDGETLSVWWPRYFFGLRVRNLTVPPRNEVGDAIFSNTEWLLNRYEVDEHPAAPVAGRAVEEWVCTPDEPAPWRFPYQAAMDTRYFVPLRLDVQDHEGQPWYSMRSRPSFPPTPSPSSSPRARSCTTGTSPPPGSPWPRPTSARSSPCCSPSTCRPGTR